MSWVSHVLKRKERWEISEGKIEQKIKGKANLDEVLNLYQWTTAVGGHTVDLTPKASATYFNDVATTLASQIQT